VWLQVLLRFSQDAFTSFGLLPLRSLLFFFFAFFSPSHLLFPPLLVCRLFVLVSSQVLLQPALLTRAKTHLLACMALNVTDQLLLFFIRPHPDLQTALATAHFVIKAVLVGVTWAVEWWFVTGLVSQLKWIPSPSSAAASAAAAGAHISYSVVRESGVEPASPPPSHSTVSSAHAHPSHEPLLPPSSASSSAAHLPPALHLPTAPSLEPPAHEREGHEFALRLEGHMRRSTIFSLWQVLTNLGLGLIPLFRTMAIYTVSDCAQISVDPAPTLRLCVCIWVVCRYRCN
jgi:hypothetical protein